MKKYLAPGLVVLIGVIISIMIFSRTGNVSHAETFIDVRTDQEWAAGHIDGAIHFDLARLQAGEFPSLAKNTAIALYCRTGHRAGEALTILEQNGYTNVRNAGGFQDLLVQGMKGCAGTQSSCN